VLGTTGLERTQTGVIEQRPVNSLVRFGQDGKVVWKAPETASRLPLHEASSPARCTACHGVCAVALPVYLVRLCSRPFT
jgi:hypothetical protein